MVKNEIDAVVENGAGGWRDNDADGGLSHQNLEGINHFLSSLPPLGSHHLAPITWLPTLGSHHYIFCSSAS
ncbi:hypothetical protein Pmani_021682 [Petrolisthes manimaculis]|uniref:Uncharacterized protein n=1 Tax=Petrolisthes manimaculis TaxID=1843537 RepID=A0AAE1U1X3_9EUCA|nr:hypothetical protein Pmani_021682 [Petrolisthes manimaculis]